MLIWIIITVIFLGIIYKFLNNSKILALNFIFYGIFLWILVFQSFLLDATGLVTKSSRWIELSEYLIILSISLLAVLVPYILWIIFWKIKKYFWEQFIILTYLLLWFSFFTIFHIFNIFTWGESEFLLKVYSDRDILYFVIFFIILKLILLYLFWYLLEKIYVRKNF